MMDRLLMTHGSSSTGGPGSVEARNFNLVALGCNNAGINAIIDSKITVNSGKVLDTNCTFKKGDETKESSSSVSVNVVMQI